MSAISSGEPQCTVLCRSKTHAEQVLAAIVRGTEDEALAYINWACHNHGHIVDKYGRNAALIAASTGKTRVVEWLLMHGGTVTTCKDEESGYSLLHRSLFYGHIQTAVRLIQFGCNLTCEDNEHLTPLEHVMKDRLAIVEFNRRYPCEVYVWGDNQNDSLGGHQIKSRQPEMLDNFRKEGVNVKQVHLDTFHSVFVCGRGEVYTCGHGQGGRLGHGSENSELTPRRVKIDEVVADVAVGRDHTIFLTESGSVLTCGQNQYRQLGHTPAPEKELSPRAIVLPKGHRISAVKGICAARYHSAFYTDEAIYTFGLNAGQLGHIKGNKNQATPSQVSSLADKGGKLVTACCSSGATVAVMQHKQEGLFNVYVLNDYQARGIASKLPAISNVSAVGGRLDGAMLKENFNEGELKVVMLTTTGVVFVWRESSQVLARVTYTLGRQLHVTAATLNQQGLLITTKDGELFMGVHGQKQVKVAKSKQESNRGKPFHSAVAEFLEVVKLSRVQGVHRAVAITSDPKGNNFAVLQNCPKSFLFEIPQVTSSSLSKDMAAFLNNTDLSDCIHDVIIQTGDTEVAAHRFLLASRSEHFNKLLSVDRNVIQLDHIPIKVLHNILQFLYTDSCDMITPGSVCDNLKKEKVKEAPELLLNDEMEPKDISAFQVYSQGKKNKNKQKTKKKDDKNEGGNLLTVTLEWARRLELSVLVRRLEAMKCVDGQVWSKSSNKDYNRGSLKLDRRRCSHLYDVVLQSLDGKLLPCHKCVLVARLEYFNSMLASGWIEASSTSPLPLHLNGDVLEIVVDYLYTDKVSSFSACDDAQLLCSVLVAADQLLIPRLKEICELSLCDMLSLKNAAELLELAHVCNAPQLVLTCKNFIALNLSAILEARSLEHLDDEYVVALSKYYREVLPVMSRRLITPYETPPYSAELQVVCEQFPFDWKTMAAAAERKDVERSKTKQRKISKHRKNSGSGEKSVQRKLSCDGLFSFDQEAKRETKPPSYSPPSSPSSAENGYTGYGKKRLIDMSQDSKVVSKPKGSNDFPSLSVLHRVLPRAPPVITSLSPEPLPSPPSPPSSTVPRKTSAEFSWTSPKSTPEGRGFISLREIIEGEEEKMRKNTKERTSPLSATTPSQGNPWKIVPESPPQQNNPWKVEESPRVVKKHDSSFSQILEEEQEQRKALQQQNSKPLHLIQLEEQAMEELLLQYEAAENTYQKITVERVLPVNVARPHWTSRYYAGKSA